MSKPSTKAGRTFLAPYVRDARIEYGYVEVPTEDIIQLIDNVEAEARAEALAGAVAEAQARYDDLRWCNKEDNCHDLAEGAELVLSDLRAAADALQEALG